MLALPALSQAMTRHKALASLAAALLVTACSGSATVVPVTITGYAVATTTPPPATAHAGDSVTVGFTVTVLHSNGTATPAASKALTVAVTAGDGLVGGATSSTMLTSSSGTSAVWWQLGNTIGTQTLRASVSDSEYVDVQVTATPAGATQLALVTQPAGSATTGLVLARQPVIQLRDAGGGDVEDAGVIVTAAISTGGGALSGTTAVTTGADGIATFTDLGLTGATGTVTLSFGALLGGNAVHVLSQPIAVAPPQLLIVTQPAATATSGTLLSRQPALQLRNGDGTADLPLAGIVITAAIGSGGGTLGGTITATTDATGRATFGDLVVAGADGGVTLTFAATVSGQALAATSQNIAVGPAQQVAIITPPGNPVRSTSPFFVQPAVQLLDASGQPLALAGVAVTAAVASGTPLLTVAPGGAGSVVAFTDATGQAHFHDLLLTGTGATTLQFSAPGFVAARTGTITVLGPPTTTVLDNAVQVGPLIAGAGDLAYYAFQPPAGTLSLDVATFGGSGNAELYVRRGTPPTSADFDCHASAAGPAQICTFPTSSAAVYDVIVRAASPLSATKIRANAYGPGCSPKATVAIGTRVTGTLSAATACTVEPSQSMHDRYTLTVPYDQAFSLLASSGSDLNPIFVAYRLPGDQLNYLAAFGATPTAIGPLLLGAGTYDIFIGDYAASGVTRSYQFAFTPIFPNPSGCTPILPSSGPLHVTLTLHTSDCAGTTAGTRSHRAWIVLSSGQTVTVTMQSTAFTPLIKMLRGLTTSAGSVLALGTGSGGPTAQLTFTNNDPSSDGTFTIELTSALAAAVGDYTLTLSFGPPVYQSPRLPVGNSSPPR